MGGLAVFAGHFIGHNIRGYVSVNRIRCILGADGGWHGGADSGEYGRPHVVVGNHAECGVIGEFGCSKCGTNTDAMAHD